MIDDIPALSSLRRQQARYEYRDSFATPIRRRDVESRELVAAFFQSAPAWVDRLFALRNRLAGCLGLKSGSAHPRDPLPPLRIGQHIGLFRLMDITGSEVVLGEDDRHLDFRVSILLDSDGPRPMLIVSTLVHVRNRLGLAYFAAVRPIHRLIVPVMVRRMARKIDERSRLR